ncbi:MAG: methyltransferase domain-containing protein [Phormidesmis sp.]
MSATSLPQYFGKDLEAMSFAKNYHDWILSEFLPYIGPVIAEVGAGVGSFSHLLLQVDIVRCLQAFEPSQNMYPRLKKALSSDRQAEAIHGFFGQNQIGAEFDSVLYVNVLEHIEDDAVELTTAFKTLKQGGY